MTSILIYIVIIILFFIIATSLYKHVNIPSNNIIHTGPSIDLYSENHLQTAKENFADLHVYNPVIEDNQCYSLDPHTCIQYSNCGICMNSNIRSNNGKCIPGDTYGPFFDGSCNYFLWHRARLGRRILVG